VPTLLANNDSYSVKVTNYVFKLELILKFCRYKKLYSDSMSYRDMQVTVRRIAALGLLMIILPFIGYSQSKRAFMVGISDYSSNQRLADGKGWDDIHGENDVKLLVPTLQKQGF
jgi:hypothetical protein